MYLVPHSVGWVQPLPTAMPLRLILSMSAYSLKSKIALAKVGIQMPAQLQPVMQKSFFLKLGNLMKKSLRARRFSWAVVVSLAIRSDFDLPIENPTPEGLSRQMTLAFWFQAFLLMYIYVVFLLNIKGPFSQSIPSIDEQPGPPLSHRTTGSLTGSSMLHINLATFRRRSSGVVCCRVGICSDSRNRLCVYSPVASWGFE